MATPEFIRIEDHRPLWESWDQSRLWTGEMFGETAWSDGCIMMLGQPPPGSDSKPLDFSRPLQSASRGTLRRIHPVAIVRLRELVFSDGQLIQYKYFSLIREAYPNAQWFGDASSRRENGSVVIRVSGKIVALVMGLRQDEAEIQEVLDALKTPRAATPVQHENQHIPTKTE